VEAQLETEQQPAEVQRDEEVTNSDDFTSSDTLEELDIDQVRCCLCLQVA
jgi:hypothetical protein